MFNYWLELKTIVARNCSVLLINLSSSHDVFKSCLIQIHQNMSNVFYPFQPLFTISGQQQNIRFYTDGQFSSLKGDFDRSVVSVGPCTVQLVSMKTSPLTVLIWFQNNFLEMSVVDLIQNLTRTFSTIFSSSDFLKKKKDELLPSLDRRHRHRRRWLSFAFWSLLWKVSNLILWN